MFHVGGRFQHKLWNDDARKNAELQPRATLHPKATWRGEANRPSFDRNAAARLLGQTTPMPRVQRVDRPIQPPRVEDLAQSVTDAVSKFGGDQKAVLEAVSKALEEFLKNPKAIPNEMIRPSPEHYTRTLLYRDPERRFIVAMMVWSAGQKSPIHDHECWGAVGVYRGAVSEIRYEKNETVGLKPGARTTYPEGAVAVIDPPDIDLHVMGNASSQVTVSVHVYGRDMTSSNVYDPTTGERRRGPMAFHYRGPLVTADP